MLSPLQSVCAFVTSFPYNPDFVALTDLIAAQDAASGESGQLVYAVMLYLPTLLMSAPWVPAEAPARTRCYTHANACLMVPVSPCME